MSFENLKLDFESNFAYTYRKGFDGFSGYFRAFAPCIIAESSLKGIDSQLQQLFLNTLNFLNGKNAANTLLWGARGCGKSSSIAFIIGIFYQLQLGKRLTFCNKNVEKTAFDLRIVEISNDSLGIVPILMDCIRELSYRFIIVCDDLSFNPMQNDYKVFKSLLEGSLESKPSNVLLYVSTNQRHLVAENYKQDTLHLDDAQDELLSLSDRFGLSIGFYTLGSDEYLEIVDSIFAESNFKPMQNYKQKALNFATLKGSRNPRIAKEFCKLYQSGVIL